MKGLAISLFSFILYVIVTAALARWLRPRRPAKLFVGALLAFTPLYFLLYWVTPRDCFLLPLNWLSDQPGVEIILGYIIFLLNWHSYIDFFFGFNGGFSMSLLLELSRAAPAGLSTEKLLQSYLRSDGTDKIYAWRLPRLQQTGYISINAQGLYQLTPKGRLVAHLTWFLKRILNLGLGG